jgi:hypothetical protein
MTLLPSLPRLRRRALAVVAALGALAGLGTLAGPAAAAMTTTVPCRGDLSSPFAPWGDAAAYTLAPGGDFEGDMTGWILGGGTAVVPGSEPWAATGVQGAKALSLSAGAAAVSSSVCVDPTRETFRFFARNVSGAAKARLKVEVMSPRRDGTWSIVQVGTLRSDHADWQPSPVYLNPANLDPALGDPLVRYHFVAVNGAWQVDDLFVDPFARR